MRLQGASSRFVVVPGCERQGTDEGQNIPRGKAVERDARADNPFIDTVSSLLPNPFCVAKLRRPDRIHYE